VQITIKGEMKLSELLQALYEKLGELEDDYAIQYSKGATLYVNPTNGEGEPVVARRRDGRAVVKLLSDGPYRSAADELKP
jgi:hypothetical protein